MPGHELVLHCRNLLKTNHFIPLFFSFLEIYYKYEKDQIRNDLKGYTQATYPTLLIPIL